MHPKHCVFIAWNEEERENKRNREGREAREVGMKGRWREQRVRRRILFNLPISSSSPTSCGKAVSVKSCLSFEGREREEGQAEIDTPSQRSFWSRWRGQRKFSWRNWQNTWIISPFCPKVLTSSKPLTHHFLNTEFEVQRVCDIHSNFSRLIYDPEHLRPLRLLPLELRDDERALCYLKGRRKCISS